MSMQRKERLDQLRHKFLSMLSAEELERQCKKCPNRWVWSAVELERARREAKEYVAFFDQATSSPDL